MLVYISATLRNFFDKNVQLDVEADNIKDALRFLTDEYPDSKKVLFDDEGKLRSFVQIYVGDENYSHIDNWSRAIDKAEEVILLPAIAGGAPEESIISDARRKEVAFDDSEVERFSKHLMLREIGVKGQKKLLNAKVLIIGAGGLGAPAAMYLAAAGVGTIGIVDADVVDLSNLQRQVIHTTNDIGKKKVESAADKALKEGQIKLLKASIERREKLLSNENYVKKAPQNIVELDRKKLEEEKKKLEELLK